MADILFSFIIPTYNRAHLLTETLMSILSQKNVELQVVVVDDGSVDQTGDIVKNINDTRIIYKRIANSERGAARNVGLKFATGRYVNFFDSDDILSNCLTDLSSFINANDYPDVVYGIIDSGSSLSIDSSGSKSLVTNLLYNNFLACGSVFLKREVAEKFPFHEDRRLSSAEDWELWLRVKVKHEFTFFPFVVFEQKNHDGRSLTSIQPDRIEQRDTYFAELVLSNDELINYYGLPALKLFTADRFTFIALSWCNSNKVRAIQYLRCAGAETIRVVKRRRFWGVLKSILFR